MSQAERRFASQGHVYFSDSVRSFEHAVLSVPVLVTKQDQALRLAL